jgi:hypothetical protein
MRQEVMILSTLYSINPKKGKKKKKKSQFIVHNGSVVSHVTQRCAHPSHLVRPFSHGLHLTFSSGNFELELGGGGSLLTKFSDLVFIYVLG